MLIILACSGIYAQTTVHYKFKAGDTFHLLQEANQTITQDIYGTQQVINNILVGGMEIKVITVTPEKINLEMSFTSLNMKMTSPTMGELMNIDTTNPEPEDVQYKIFKSMLGYPIPMVMEPTGKRLEIDADSLMKRMIAATEIEDEMARSAMREGLSAEWGSDALINSFEQMLYMYNSAPVQEGSTWETALSEGNKVSAQTTWTLTSMGDTINEIKGSGSASMHIENAQITMDLSGTQQCELTADAHNGMIKRLMINGTYEGTSVSSQLPDLTIPTTIISSTIYTLQLRRLCLISFSNLFLLPVPLLWPCGSL